jgi:hypothetical protein
MMNKSALILTGVISLFGCSNNKELLVSYLNAGLEYSGRIDTTQHKGADLFWSGSSVKINFEGESIQVSLKDERGDNYFNVIIDDDIVHILRPDTTTNSYLLASGLHPGKHTVEIFKRTEYTKGKTTFYNFIIQENAKILPRSEKKKRKIEFYGDSITAGYAVEDLTGSDSPDSTYTNNYVSYAALTARHYDADYTCICRSGIGITISWFKETMPDIYDRLIPTDSASTWNFANDAPNIIVVNLFQNDSWLVNLPNHPSFKNKFGTKAPKDDFFINAYKNFISEIRSRYPEASIICMLGNMNITKEGSKWIHYVNQAVEDLRDEKVYSLVVPYKGTNGHPSRQEQENLSGNLIDFIDKNLAWQ